MAIDKDLQIQAVLDGTYEDLVKNEIGYGTIVDGDIKKVYTITLEDVIEYVIKHQISGFRTGDEYYPRSEVRPGPHLDKLSGLDTWYFSILYFDRGADTRSGEIITNYEYARRKVVQELFSDFLK